jgi:hypothetical protein
MVVLGGLGEVDVEDGRSLPSDAVHGDVEDQGNFAKAFENWQANIRNAIDGA